MERLTLDTQYVESRRETSTSHSVNRRRWLLNCGSVSFICGALSPALGSLLTVLSWLAGHGTVANSLHALGSIFLILTIPLLGIAGICLDAYERRGGRIDFDWWTK